MELHIRRFKKTDQEHLYQLLSDGEVMRYIEPPFSWEQTEAFLRQAGLSQPPLIYAVEDAEGGFVGYVIYHDYEGDSREIGWVLKRDAWGKGYAQLLTEKLIAWALAEHKTPVIECVPEQQVTKHIAEKFGFTFIGRQNGCDVYKLDAAAAYDGGPGLAKLWQRKSDFTLDEAYIL